jgi:hypothetical protein
LFCQLGQAHSLREICGGLAGCFGKAKHMGIQAAPKRSTLSYANQHRPWQLYEKIFYQLLGKCQYLKFRSSFQWSLSNLVAMLRYNLFTYRDLWSWIGNPFEPPPVAVMAEQLSLNWTARSREQKKEAT